MKQIVGGDGEGTPGHTVRWNSGVNGEKVGPTVGDDGEWEGVHEVVVTQ